MGFRPYGEEGNGNGNGNRAEPRDARHTTQAPHTQERHGTANTALAHLPRRRWCWCWCWCWWWRYTSYQVDLAIKARTAYRARVDWQTSLLRSEQFGR